MKSFPIFYIYLLVFAGCLIFTILNNQTSCLRTYFDNVKSIVDFSGPIGLLILGLYGLSEWKHEYTFRKHNELAEDIARSILDLKNSLYDIRVNWPIMYASDPKFTEGMGEEEAFFNAPVTHLNFHFSEQAEKKLSKRIDKAIRKKDDLEQKLKIANILWNMKDIEKSADDLFSFFYEILNAISRLFRRKGDTDWIFERKEIEVDKDLKLVLHFAFRTKNKSIEELNSFYDTEFNSRSTKILNKISNFLY